MRIIFMGSAELSIPSLKGLLQSPVDEVVGVVSQPDKPAGRKRLLTACPLKSFAKERGIDVLTPKKIGDHDIFDHLASLEADLLVVVAYGQYLPQRVIQLAPAGAINVHPSLLPKYRGSAPIQWSLLNGDTKTGVSIIRLAKKMDAGDILRQEEWQIDPDDTSQTLHDKLAIFGAELLMKAVEDIRADKVETQPQHEGEVVEVRKLSKLDSPIDWTLAAEQIRNRIRAFNPWPGCTCNVPGGNVLKVWSATVEKSDTGEPGQVLDDKLLVATGENALRLTEVQPAGKKRMPSSVYLLGRPVRKGELMT